MATTSEEKPKQKLKRASRELASEGGLRPREDGQEIVEYIHAKGGMKAAVDTLFECLQAVRTYYDLYSKSMVTEPDYATRLGAAKALIANEVGEPIKRQQILIHNVDSTDDLKAKLATNPALCDSLANMIKEAQSAKNS